MGRILALFVFASIVSLLVSLIQTVGHAQDAEHHQYTNAQVVAVAAGSEIETRLANLVGLARTIERMPGFWDAADTDRDAWLTALVASQPELNALGFVTPDLQQHGASNYDADHGRADLSNREFAQEALLTGGVAVARRPLQALGGTERVLPVAIPVREQTPSGRSGLVVGSLRLDRLPGVWGATPLPTGSDVMLVDTRSGLVLTGTSGAISRVGETLQIDAPDQIARDGSTYRWTSVAGAPQLRAASQVDGTPWVVIVDVPANAILSPIYTSAWQFAAIHLSVCAIILFLLILLRRTLLVRLGDLADSARCWAHGEWTHRASIAGDDEVTHLGRAFNLMADELRRTSAALADEHAERELRLLRQAALLQMARGFAVTTDLNRLLDDIVGQAIDVLHAEYGSLTRWDDDQNALVTVRWTIPGAPIGGRVQDGSLAATTAARRMPTIMNAYAESVSPSLPAHRAGVRAAVAVPLFHEGRLIGTLGVSSTVPDTSYAQVDVETLELLGSLAAATLVGREREEMLRARATTDPLTGLANRRHATEQIDRLISLAARRSDPLALAMLDLDHFKSVNDQYGHAAGDEVLRRLAVAIREAFRAEDVVSRWGGEEFVLGMYGSTAVSGAERLSSVLAQFQAEVFTSPDGTPFSVTFSAGIAELRRDGNTIEALCGAADRALYAAKAGGRAKVRVASPRVRPHLLHAVQAG